MRDGAVVMSLPLASVVVINTPDVSSVVLGMFRDGPAEGVNEDAAGGGAEDDAAGGGALDSGGLVIEGGFEDGDGGGLLEAGG